MKRGKKERRKKAREGGSDGWRMERKKEEHLTLKLLLLDRKLGNCNFLKRFSGNFKPLQSRPKNGRNKGTTKKDKEKGQKREYWVLEGREKE